MRGLSRRVSEVRTQMNNNAVAMGDSGLFERIMKLGSLLIVAATLWTPADSLAQVNRVETVRDEQGWRLKVDGEDFFIKGVVWGYSPRGQNYTYNLWGESDDFIRKVLDYEMGLMKAAGINAIRTFSMVPPEWITYIYEEHGIMSVVNPLMGRYGYNVGGKWIPFTDYSDPLTRETLIRDMTAIVQQYKNTRGVLMFAFGNESNYGLSWSSFEIENLPEGEQNTAKARYLYSLWNEVIVAGKAVAPDHLFTIVNGDIQYIDLIAELVPDMDLLGSNVYRGPSFTTLWAEVDAKLDVPVVFFEFGSDAFNARSFREDQAAQALILKDQWLEMYNKAWGNQQEGNSIGAFVFEWRDEWWKYLQIENLNIQDTNASWSNQAYQFDWAEGQNNMNEEWFGITALGPANAEGVYEARPRMAYDVLAEVFAMDPYALTSEQINASFATMDTGRLELQGEVRQLKAESNENKSRFKLTGGELRLEFAFRGTEESINVNGKEGTDFSDGQMAFLDFAFNPTENLDGQLSLNILGNVPRRRPVEFNYGDRGLPLVINAETQVGEIFENREIILRDRERVEIYDFSATYESENFDVEAFYHTPRFHWGYEGDFFNLVQEATDIVGIDVWNGKAPSGVEMNLKGKLDGVKIVAGPEVFWGANPQWIFKYDFNIGKTPLTFIHQEEVSRLGEGANATAPTNRVASKTTLFADIPITEKVKLEVGGIISSRERLDDVYDYVDDQENPQNIFRDKIEFKDLLGIRARLTFPILGAETYLSAHNAGLVADGGNPIPTFGVTDPTRLPYSALGNKNEYEAGMRIYKGNWLIYPRYMYRTNLIDANPFVEPSVNPDGTLNPGTSPRDRDTDPFAVLNNREAQSGEIYVTWDPTGATPFYDWDNDWREDAKFAFNLGGTYTRFPTATDANLFFFEPSGSNASFGRGLPAEDVWSVTSRMVFNPSRGQRYILSLARGFDQSTGDPEGGTRKFFDISGRAFIGRNHLISAYFKKDNWGPYDFQRQFNIVYPEQYMFDYAFLLNGTSSVRSIVDEVSATRIGFRTTVRFLDEDSPEDEFLKGENDYIFLALLYLTYSF